MSFDDDELRRRREQSHDKNLTSPNQKLQKQDHEMSEKKKELTELKAKVERSQVMQMSDQEQGTGGMKKNEVITGGTKSGGRDTQQMQIRQERLKADVEKQKGTTEQGRKTP